MKKRQTILLATVAISLVITVFFLLSNISWAANANGPNNKNVTVWTHVNITNAKPEVLQVLVYQETNASAKNITLSAGSIRLVTCNATVRDWNGYSDIVLVNATLWDALNSTINSSNNNNSHYTNTNCSNYGNGVNFTVNYICNFSVYYYANNGTWNCNVTAYDTYNKSGTLGNNTLLYSLYALNVTDGIDYGSVAVEDTSSEMTANVTNFGNMPINLTLEGYGVRQGDGLAMNCSINGNITVDNERFAVASGVWGAKTALTSSQQLAQGLTIVKQTSSNTPIVNSTYWQLYIPPNPAGNSTCYVIFTAQAS